MSKILEFTTDNDATVAIEAVEMPKSGAHDSGKDAPVDLAGLRLSGVLDKITDVSDAVAAKLDGLEPGKLRPAETSVEFGLCVTTEAGVFVAKAAAQGSLKVTMTWRSNETGGEPSA